MLRSGKGWWERSAAAGSKRGEEGRERGTREGEARVEAALSKLDGVEAQRQRRRETTGKNEKKKEPRASTTDPDARVMKMADGGFRPAYNVQVIRATGTPLVVDAIGRASCRERVCQYV